MADRRTKAKAAKKAKPRKATPRRASERARRDTQGRVHLLIHSDPLGRPDGLGLSGPLFVERWQNDVVIGAANTTHACLDQGHTRDRAVELARNLLSGASKIGDGALARSAPDRAVACRAGCAHCCHQAVGVSAPEVFAIHDHLRATCSPLDLELVIQRVRDADDRTRGLTPGERLSPALPCPFLDEDDRCSVHDARPLACRGTNSLDADACARTLRDPAAHAAFIAGQASVPCFLEPVRACHAVAAGMQLALADLHGLEVAPLELTAAMRILLDDPEGVPERWLGGGDPFAEARGADTTDDERMARLLGRVRP